MREFRAKGGGFPVRVMLGAAGLTGHAFPILALAMELRSRGHEVTVHTWEHWRDVVTERDLGFIAEQPIDFFGVAGENVPYPSLAEATETLREILRDLRPDVVVTDLFTMAPALAAELDGLRLATLIPHPYPLYGDGLPIFPLGALPPRTAPGRWAWRVAGRAEPILQPRIRRVRQELDEARAELGLEPSRHYHGPVSEELTMVATFPQLEYPRRWSRGTHVTGPMPFELPHPPIELPPGDDPLVVVTGSTGQDPKLGLVRLTLEALADEPVRVVATMNRRGHGWGDQVPSNAVVVDWVSYAQVMPPAALVVSSGGHGTVARALIEGTPLLICPELADMAWNGARVAWAGVGLMVPRALRRPSTLRWALRRVLADPSFAARARELEAWNAANPGAARGASLIERYAGGGR